LVMLQHCNGAPFLYKMGFAKRSPSVLANFLTRRSLQYWDICSPCRPPYIGNKRLSGLFYIPKPAY
jgi:hypothetical protein